MRHLNLRPLAPAEASRVEAIKLSDELAMLTGRGHGLPTDEVLAPVRRFYRPWNQALARMLGDNAFLWRDQRRGVVEH